LKAKRLSILDGNFRKTQAFLVFAGEIAVVLLKIGEKKTAPKNRLS
jgi:hypothetical protein